MALPTPRLTGVQSVLQFADPFGRDPARDEQLIQGVRNEFPNVVARQLLPPDAPLINPHLVLTSTSSQLAVSAVSAQFQVQFYGEYLSDVEKALEYVERKLRAILVGLQAADLVSMTAGIVASMHFPFGQEEAQQAAVDHLLSTHLRSDVDAAEVQDAQARIAVRVRDTYFVTLTVANYENRMIERPVFPGRNLYAVRPWEGHVNEVGIELAIDINNILEARLQGNPVVTEVGVAALTRLLRMVATESGPRFAETGVLDAAELTERSLA